MFAAQPLTPTKKIMYQPKSLQNQSDWTDEKSFIIIKASDPEWAEAFANWQKGKPPTTSPDWKKGVFLTFEEKYETESI